MKALFKCVYDSNKKKFSETFQLHFFATFKKLDPQDKCDIIEYIQYQLQKEYDINKEIYYDGLDNKGSSSGFYETTIHKLTR
tara:strand:- start:3688 stop:3933 length:246 start_codon:yes stop_codon:yes gene_type:complete